MDLTFNGSNYLLTHPKELEGPFSTWRISASVLPILTNTHTRVYIYGHTKNSYIYVHLSYYDRSGSSKQKAEQSNKSTSIMLLNTAQITRQSFGWRRRRREVGLSWVVYGGLIPPVPIVSWPSQCRA